MFTYDKKLITHIFSLLSLLFILSFSPFHAWSTPDLEFVNTNLLSFHGHTNLAHGFDVIIKNDSIEAVRPHKPGKRSHPVINGKNLLLSPGFVNTHSHLVNGSMGHFFSNKKAYKNAAEWVAEMSQHELKLTQTNRIDAIKKSTRHFIKSGILYFNDMSIHSEDVNQTLKQLQLPHVIGETYFSKKHHRSISTQSTLQVSPPLKSSLNFLSFHGLMEYHKSGKGINGKRIHFHTGEFKDDGAQILNKMNIGQLNGIFSKPKMIILAHGAWLDDKVIISLSKHKHTISINYSSNHLTKKRIPHVSRWHELGINLTVGTDSPITNPEMNYFKDLKAITRLLENDFGSKIAAEKEVLKMATIYGYKALGIENLWGKIEKGNKASFVTYNYIPDKTTILNHLDPTKIHSIYHKAKLSYNNEQFTNHFSSLNKKAP